MADPVVIASGMADPVVLASPSEVTPSKATLATMKNSALAIGFYPTFKYNATGGGGVADVTPSTSGRLNLVFNTQELQIPTVNWRTARLLGAPLPPFLKIDIEPTKLEGEVDRQTGQVELTFHAKFFFSAGMGLYKAPPMFVETLLTTEGVQSTHHKRPGKRLDKDGHAVLVGVAEVAPTGNRLLDGFLRLPTDVLGLMTSQLTFQE